MVIRKSKKSKGVHYVDNKEFLKAMVEFKEDCKVALDNEEEQPSVSNYIGECFLKIATHLSYRPNFINYTYRDDMIAKEKKQTHVKNKMIENSQYTSWVTMDGDDSSYSVLGFDPNIMLPDEDVYKPKKKLSAKSKGLETFMEDDDIDKVAERGID